MRTSFAPLIALTLVFAVPSALIAQGTGTNPFTATLVLGSSGLQVMTLQKLLNSDPDTRIATSGVGSPGNETEYFGALTRAAVVRFQEKYASEVLAPVDLTTGNGRVGVYTRAKLNALSVSAPTPITVSPVSPPAPAPSPTDTFVKESEKIDIYAGDTMIAKVEQKLRAAVDAAIISGGATGATMPTIAPSELPSVTIQSLSPNSGLPGGSVLITGKGVLANSVIYFGNDRIVRSTTRDLSGSYSFTIPSIVPKRYDVAVVTSGAVSNTTSFIVVDPRNPQVRVATTSPAVIPYDGMLTITGSGFAPENNIVVTTYQTFKNIPSSDGKTLTVRFAPENLRESAKVGIGAGRVPVGVYVINDYGFSNTDKSFTMSL